MTTEKPVSEGAGPYRAEEITLDRAPDRWAVLDTTGARVGLWIEYEHDAVRWAEAFNAAYHSRDAEIAALIAERGEASDLPDVIRRLVEQEESFQAMASPSSPEFTHLHLLGLIERCVFAGQMLGKEAARALAAPQPKPSPAVLKVCENCVHGGVESDPRCDGCGNATEKWAPSPSLPRQPRQPPRRSRRRSKGRKPRAERITA